MGFWGAPDVQKLKMKKDVNGLNKLLSNADYEVRKEAILALIDLREIISPPSFVTDLIRDDSSVIRQKAYCYSIAGDFGLMMNIAGAHDFDPHLRDMSIDNLSLSIKNSFIKNFITKCKENDPNKIIKEKCQLLLKKSEINFSEPDISENVTNNYRNEVAWFSAEAVYDDLLDYITAFTPSDEDFSSEVGKKFFFIFNSPLMNGCQKYFLEAGNHLKSGNPKKAYSNLGAVISFSVEGLNAFSASFPLGESMKFGKLPYQDYQVASIIMSVLIEKSIR